MGCFGKDLISLKVLSRSSDVIGTLTILSFVPGHLLLGKLKILTKMIFLLHRTDSNSLSLMSAGMCSIVNPFLLDRGGILSFLIYLEQVEHKN